MCDPHSHTCIFFYILESSYPIKLPFKRGYVLNIGLTHLLNLEQINMLFGLSYVERPILGDHLKAHTLKTENWRISLKSGGFHEKWQFSHENRQFS